jgi:SAM-dependent methyltransferase
VDDIGNYKEHAAVWDWDAYDNTNEYDFWYNWAIKYGENILIPMCALGEIGAYMAKKGLNVTAFDITQEMVVEGNKRFNEIKNLKILYSDVRDFSFDINKFDFCFIKGQDLGHLLKTEDIEKAFYSINKHLRKNGALIIETILPPKETSDYPLKTFYPREPKHLDKKIWKTGKGSINSETKRNHISQTIFIEDKDGIKQFTHEFYLQYYERKIILELLKRQNYKIVNEYADQNFTKWSEGNNNLIIEALKT